MVIRGTGEKMNDREKFDRLSELMQDDDFARGLYEQQTPEDAQSYFAKNGIELSLDEVKAIGKVAAETIEKVRSGEMDADKAMKATSGELTEDELEAVAGGFIVTFSLVACGYVVSGWALAALAASSAVVTGGTIAVAKNWDAVTEWFESW